MILICHQPERHQLWIYVVVPSVRRSCSIPVEHLSTRRIVPLSIPRTNLPTCLKALLALYSSRRHKSARPRNVHRPRRAMPSSRLSSQRQLHRDDLLACARQTAATSMPFFPPFLHPRRGISFRARLPGTPISTVQAANLVVAAATGRNNSRHSPGT